MAKESPQSSTPYQPEAYLRTGVNLSALTWLVLLGVPVLLLFLIYTKIDERKAPAEAPDAMHMAQPHH